MTRIDIEAELKSFIVNEALDGKPDAIDSDSPLLEWGVIDSIIMAKLLAFVESRFGIDVPPAEVSAENFGSLRAIAALLTSLSPQGAGQSEAQTSNGGA